MGGTLVQARSTEGNASAPTLAFLSNPAAANLIAASASVFSNTVTSVVHTGDTFTRIGTGSVNGSARIEGYYAKNIVGGASTMTFNFGSTTDYGIGIEEWAGLDTVAPLNDNNAATGTSAAPDGGAVNAPADGIVWGAFTSLASANNPTGEGANFVIGTEQESTVNMPIHTENRGQGGGLAAGSYSTPATISAPFAWAAISAAFKSAAGATPAGTNIALAARNNQVGPTVQRFARRSSLPVDMTQAPVTDTNFGFRVRVPNNRVGPMALRQLYRPPAYPFDSTVVTGATTNRLRRVICAGA